MSVTKLIAHFQKCVQRLSELRQRQDYLALTCAILRVERASIDEVLYQPFAHIINDRPVHEIFSATARERFTIAYFPLEAGKKDSQIKTVLDRIETCTKELMPLLRELPESVRERLQMPEHVNWWRILFHLSWHFPRPFLNAQRQRIAKNNVLIDETIAQLYGMGPHQDLYPGFIYSRFEQDLCTISETAIEVVIELLEESSATTARSSSEAPVLAEEIRLNFDRLRQEFTSAKSISQKLECKLLKLANSFESPSAISWASLKPGGTTERILILSRRNEHQEIALIRGSATTWFCQLAERAGETLPSWIPDRSILFDAPMMVGQPTPIFSRDACERWVGFVFATLKQYASDSLKGVWGTESGPLEYGYAELHCDLFEASVLAIDLARLSTVAIEGVKLEREKCSPFSVPSMQEMNLRWEDEEIEVLEQPRVCTLHELTQYLRDFAETYCQTMDRIRAGNPHVAIGQEAQLAVNVSTARNQLLSFEGLSELRSWIKDTWNEEISDANCQRVVQKLRDQAEQNLIVDDVLGLSLVEVVSCCRTGNFPTRVVTSTTDTNSSPLKKTSSSSHLSQLLDIFANGVVDKCFEKIEHILSDDTLRVNDKLTKTDALIPIPFTASAEQLGKLLRVSKQAVMKTEWWKTNRKGEKQSEIGRRRDQHHTKAEGYESSNSDEE